MSNRMWHLITGIMFITLGLWGMAAWWSVFGMVMRGVLPFMMIVLGIVALLSSYYRLQASYDDFDDEEE